MITLPKWPFDKPRHSPPSYDTSVKSGAWTHHHRRGAAGSGTLSSMFGRRRRGALCSPRRQPPALGSNAFTAKRRAASGFTLLEVLVALAIAIPALAMLYRQGVVSMGVTQTSTAYQEAISRAQSHLDALSDDSLVPGERTGDDGDGFAWRIRIAPIASTAPPRPAPRASYYARGTSLFAVMVEISWPGGSGRRTLTLDTRRLGPASAAGL